MKTRLLSLLALSLLTGCAMFQNPVPTNNIEVNTPYGKFVGKFSKDAAFKNFALMVRTNGEATVSIGEYSATNNPMVIDKSWAGQVLYIQAVDSMAQHMAETAVKAAAKGAAGGM